MYEKKLQSRRHLLQLKMEKGLQSKCEQALIFQPSNVEHAHLEL